MQLTILKEDLDNALMAHTATYENTCRICVVAQALLRVTGRHWHVSYRNAWSLDGDTPLVGDLGQPTLEIPESLKVQVMFPFDSDGIPDIGDTYELRECE